MKKQRFLAIFLTVFSLVIFCSLSCAAGQKTIKCEILDAGRVKEAYTQRWGNIHYMIIHHTHSEDRAELSGPLRVFSGEEVSFSINGKMYRALLFRLPQCFGRGLLLYKGPVSLKKKDIIRVEFER